MCVAESASNGGTRRVQQRMMHAQVFVAIVAHFLSFFFSLGKIVIVISKIKIVIEPDLYLGTDLVGSSSTDSARQHAERCPTVQVASANCRTDHKKIWRLKNEILPCEAINQGL